MAGLDPAIHVFSASRESKTRITATSAVMTPDLRRRIELLRCARNDGLLRLSIPQPRR
jgi:hypothetical protein